MEFIMSLSLLGGASDFTKLLIYITFLVTIFTLMGVVLVSFIFNRNAFSRQAEIERSHIEEVRFYPLFEADYHPPAE